MAAARNGRSLDRLGQVSKHLVKETHKVVDGVPFSTSATRSRRRTGT
jgi:hypothetical protein